MEISSGSAALDAKTCENVKERASFTPAANAAGQPVAGEFRQRFLWRLADRIMPAEDWSSEVVVTYHSDGKTITCKSEGKGAFKSPSTTTSGWRKNGRLLENCVESASSDPRLLRLQLWTCGSFVARPRD